MYRILGRTEGRLGSRLWVAIVDCVQVNIYVAITVRMIDYRYVM